MVKRGVEGGKRGTYRSLKSRGEGMQEGKEVTLFALLYVCTCVCVYLCLCVCVCVCVCVID